MCFTKEYKAIWKENLVIYLKSLATLFQAPLKSLIFLIHFSGPGCSYYIILPWSYSHRPRSLSVSFVHHYALINKNVNFDKRLRLVPLLLSPSCMTPKKELEFCSMDLRQKKDYLDYFNMTMGDQWNIIIKYFPSKRKISKKGL